MKKTVRKGKRGLGLLLALSLMVSLLTAPAGAIVTGVSSGLDQGNNVVLDNGNPDPASSNGEFVPTGSNGDSDPAGSSEGSDPDGSGGESPEPQQPVFQWSMESRLNRDYLTVADTTEGALGFTLTASPDADNTLAADTLTVSASLTLPEGLDLPQGKYTWDGRNLFCDNVPVAELTAAEASVTADYNDETGVFTVVLAWTDVDAAQSSTLSFGQDVLDWTDYTLVDTHQVKLEAELETQAQGAELVQVQAPEVLADLVETAGIVTVLERQDITCPVRYLDKNGQVAPRLEAQPQFALFCSVDGQAVQELTAELAAQLGMAELPQLQITNDANSWTADITELPSRISVSDGQGGAVEQTIDWSIQVSGDAEKYDLRQLTADEAKQYPGASGAGWYYIFNEDTVDYVEGDTVSVEYIKDDIIHDVYWRDNNDEDKIRPTDATSLYELQFAWDGSSVYQPVKEQDLAALGLTSLPTAVLTDQGNNHFQLVVDGDTLPSKVTYTDDSGKHETHTVAWRMVIQDVSGYTRVEVAEDEQGEFASYDEGTYYILQEDFNITVQLRRGNTTMGAGITQAFQNEFALKVIYGQGNEDEILLSSLEGTAVKVEFEAPDADHPNTAYITIRNVWRYYMDGSRVVYSVQKADGQTRLDLDSLPEGDYFSISYDNSAVPNYGTQVDRVYNGGTLNFSLAGTTTYDAQKVWLDNEDNVRPEAELQLWRYRSDKSYTTAAPVRDAQGDIITLTLDGSDVQTIQFSGDLDGDGTEESELPKYDPEGYEYIYVSKEFLSGITDADSYEQVFGVVETDGSVTDTVPYFDPDTNGVIYVQDDSREAGNDFLYQGGTLSNRVTGNIVLSGTKQWKAAAFQAEFENVTVELMAQCRPASSQEGWQDTEYRVTMDDFYAENLSITQSMALPLYDELGQRLEYRWVEARVTQDGEPVPAFSHPDGSITFTLEQAGRQVIYRSESILQSDDSTLVVNTIANTIRYDVTKVWRDENGADISQDKVGTETEFALYRATSGNDMTEYLTFTMDGVVDQQATQIQVSDGASVTCQETASWQAEILGLPEFDENGSQYEYMIVEAGGQWMPNIQTDRDLEGYHSIVTNIPGEGYRILVRKEWVDDSDVQHRQPVTVGVYTRDTNTLIATTTLEEGQWFAYVGLGSDGQGHYYTPDEVYVLETKVGDTELSLQDYTIGQGEPSSQPTVPEEYSTDGVVNTSGDWTRIQYRTDYHLYEATYSSGTIGTDEVYFITNRRLGQVDLTVEKTWITGDSGRDALRQALEEAGIDLALKLEFQSEQKANYEITSSGFGDAQAGDTITISGRAGYVAIQDQNGNPVDSIQLLDLSLDSQSVYFFHLPKYDQEGASVRYTIREIFVDADGNEITPIQLAKNYPEVYLASQEYSVTYQAGDYEVTPDHTRDTQTIQVVNQLSDTKTVTWYCLWKDAYVYESGERPDIYLDIYRQVHYLDENGQVATRVELVMPRYKWVYDDISPDSDKKSFWVAQMEGLQKYDDLGYEITYYAVESTSVDYTQFNYLPPQYSSGKDTTGEHIFGSVQDAGTGGNDVCDVTALAGETSYALREGCTFVNLISSSIVFEGGKVWKNLPEDYPHEDLPRIRLSLDRSVAGDTTGALEQDVAWLEISPDQWEELWSNGVYSFRMEYLGQNFLSKQDGTLTVTGGADAQPLPRFDSEGRLYQYTLGEEILLDNTSAGNAGEDLFDTTVAGSTVTNRFDSPEGAISVKKLLTVPTNLEQYPAIIFQLTRTYTKNDGTTSQPEIYMTENWDATEVRAQVEEAAASGDPTVTVELLLTFQGLPIYAPNGSEYVYSVQEVKTNLGGYDTWAGAGDLRVQDLENGTQSTQVGGLKPDDIQAVDATFLNKFTEIREEVDLTGTKTWTDYSNYFGFRPDNLTLTLERMAPAQPYQDNQIDWQTVTVQADDIQWVKNGDTWTYTIAGLERYAPNGMAWQYRVTETQPDKYTSSPASGTVLQKGTDADGNVTMVNLTNTLQASAPFRKNWVDSDGSTITENYLGTDVTLRVHFRLQVRAAGSGADGWTDAEDYFRANLTQAAYETLFTNYSFTQSIAGAIDETSAWNSTQYFRNLPTYIQDATAQSVQLQYRVVETSIEVLQEGQTAYTQTLRVVNDSADQFHYETSGLFTPWYGSQSATSRPNGNTIHYNQLTTTDLTVEKVWDGDSDNDYGTRPEANRTGYEWRTSLVIQRSLDGGQWENLTDGDGQVCVVTLYGKEGQDSASASVADLPNYLISNGQLIPCQYRAAELPAGWTDGDDTDQWLEDGQRYNGSYTVAYAQNGSTLTVTNAMDTTQVQADKQWIADPGTVPTNIILELKYLGEDGTTWKPFSPTARVVLNGQADPNPSLPYYEAAPDDATNWNALWTNVPLVMPGSQLDDQGHTQYKVFEVTVPSGFQMTQNSDTSITNTQTITPSVQKYWSGVTPADLPDSVTVTLLQNGTAVDTVELTEANGWHASFSSQPKYDSAGDLYTYTVAETLIDGADPADADFLISYGGSVADGFEVYNVESVDITVTKAWKDNSDAYDTRPEELALVLERTTKAQPSESDWEVVDVAQPEWTKSGNQWTLTYEDLPAATAGPTPQTYIYRVTETTPEGYVGTAGGQGSYNLTLTNTLTGTTELPVTKTWLDGDDADGLRPDSIQLELLANGTPTGQTLTLTAPVLGGNSWTGKFENLAKYDADGALITYTVQEVGEPEDYNQTGNDGANVTNTQAVTPSVQKYWSGVASEDLPDSVTVTLLQNGIAVDTVELTEANGWSASFDEQLKYDAQGNAYTYTVAETLIDGADPADTDFLISYGGSLADGFEVYNVEPVDISVTKVWKDNSDTYDTRPEELALVLERTTKAQPSESDWEVVDVAQPEWIKSGDQWTLTFEDLPKATAGANPLTYTYRVRETTPADYICTVGGQGSYNLTLTNTLTGTTELPVTKTWLDGANADGLRPDSIQLELLANGTPTGQTLTLTAPVLGGNSWTGKFENLAKYDADGALITYTVREVSEPENYNQTGNDGANVTNTQAVIPSVQKYWSGVASEDLPDSVTVTLLQNGIAVDTVELTEANGWSASFQEQLKYDAQGNAYTYTIEETLIGNAEAADTDFLISYGGSLADGFEVCNVEPVDISVTKVWKDNSDAYDTRPEELELVLERTTMAVPQHEDWEVVDMAQPQWTKTGDQWTLTYEDLPKATAGADPLTYTYRVREITPTDYVSQAERTGIYAFRFTNTLSRTLDVPVIKIWVDNDNALNMRPADIQVELLANGEPTGQTLTLTAQNLLTADGNGWLAQFTGLPEFDDQGVRIVYTVREVTVPQGYQASVEGMVVTNTGPGNLVIEKRVEGTAGETQRQFHFTLTLSDTTIDGIYGDLEFSNGVATFQLKDGQSVRVEGLPQGIAYQVTEDEADQQGYTTTARGATGTIRTGETQQVQFVNTRNDSPKTDNSPKTGDSTRPWLYVGLLTTSALVLTGVGVVSYRRRRK